MPGRLIQPAVASKIGGGARLPKLPQQGGCADEVGAIDALPHLPVRGDHDAERHAVLLELLHLRHALIRSEMLKSVMLAVCRASFPQCKCRLHSLLQLQEPPTIERSRWPVVNLQSHVEEFAQCSEL